MRGSRVAAFKTQLAKLRAVLASNCQTLRLDVARQRQIAGEPLKARKVLKHEVLTDSVTSRGLGSQVSRVSTLSMARRWSSSDRKSLGSRHLVTLCALTALPSSVRPPAPFLLCPFTEKLPKPSKSTVYIVNLNCG